MSIINSFDTSNAIINPTEAVKKAIPNYLHV